MKNITYFLGAGASYNACPIWKEQGDKMIEMSKAYQDNHNFNVGNPYREDDEKFVLWEIGYFGTKASEFNTIDTYAKKLVLNNSFAELDRLKFAVSMFFTIWQLSTDLSVKNKERYPDTIDRRYVNLLAVLLVNNGGANPTIPPNVNIVSWNYDLQLEFAYKSFCNQDRNWRDIKSNLKFTGDCKNQQICHLNGYHGYYQAGRGETDLLDRGKGTTVKEILTAFKFTPGSFYTGDIKFHNQINYAWENNDLTLRIRERAKIIFSETDILIIVGYSFPPFNKDIDKQLFSLLKKKDLQVFYQDPNLDPNFLETIFESSDARITNLPKKTDNFYIPY